MLIIPYFQELRIAPDSDGEWALAEGLRQLELRPTGIGAFK